MPFQRTVEPLTKLFPVTVNTNAALPAFVELGLIAISSGAGGGGTLIVNGKAFEVPPPSPAVLGGVKTVTLAAPALAISDAGICALN